MKQLIIFWLLLILSTQLYSENYYWVGGSGDWSVISHWATSSGGAVTHLTTPSAGDNVFFDENSFTGTGQVVTINSSIAFARNLSFEGSEFMPRFAADALTTLQIHGSLILIAEMSFDFEGNIEFSGVLNDMSIDFAGHPAGNNITFNGSGSWNVSSGITLNNMLNIQSGAIDFGNSIVNCEYLHSKSSNARFINWHNSQINIFGQTNDQSFLGSAFNVYSVEIDPTNWQSSAVNARLNMHNTNTKIFIRGAGQVHFGNITSTNSEGLLGLIYFHSDDTIRLNGDLEIANNGELLANIVMRELILSPSGRYTFESERHIEFRSMEAWADCGNFINIRSSQSGVAAQLVSSDNFSLNFVAMQDIHISGSAPVINNGIDLGNNLGWTINTKMTETLYWVGGGGNWSNPLNWSFVSGGTGSGCIPSIVDHVIFDENSFQNNAQLATIDLPNVNCRNMTWDNILPACGLLGNENQNIFVSGNLVFADNMENQFEGNFNFTGSGTGKSIQTNGIRFRNDVYFDDANAEWILLDDVFVQNDFYFYSGQLDLNDIELDIRDFTSDRENTRYLYLRNSIIYLRDRNNFSPRALIMSTRLNMDAGSSEFIFQSRSGSFEIIGLDSLRFHNIRFQCQTNNIISNVWNEQIRINIVEHQGRSYTSGNFYMDTLILFSGTWHYFDERREKTIGYLMAEADCNGLIHISAIPSRTDIATIRLLENQTVNGFYIRDLRVLSPTGSIMAEFSVDGGNNAGWVFNSSSGRNLYWVNGSGDWYDPNRWSLSSGGPGGECPPTALDDVFIDNLSFTEANNSILSNIKRTGFANNFYFTVSDTAVRISMAEISIFGDLRLEEPLDFFITVVEMEGTSTEQRIFTGTNTLNWLSVNGSGTTLLEDDLRLNQSLLVYKGEFIAENRNLRVRNFFSGNNFTPPTSRIVNSHMEIFGESFPLNNPFQVLNNSTILTETSVIDLSNQQTGVQFRNGNIRLGELIASNAQGNSLLRILTDVEIRKLILRGNAVFNNIEFSRRGIADIDSLILTAGRLYEFQSGSDTRIHSFLQARGNNCNPIGMISSVVNQRANIFMPANISINADFIEMRDLAAIGGEFNAGPYSSNINQSNIGWLFPDANEISDVIGFLGPDRYLCEGLSLVLDANNFTPTETYLWSDGSTNATLTVNDAGTYFVEINFDNNCIVRDTIEVFSPQSFDGFLPEDSFVCDNQEFEINAEVGISGAEYLWQDGSTGSSFIANVSGVYSVVVLIDGCEFEDSIEINFIVMPELDLGSELQLCQGDELVLTVPDFDGDIIWSTGSTEREIQITESGMYSVQLIRDICSVEDIVTVTFNPIPVFDFGPDQTLCDGESLILDPGFSNAAVVWQDGSSQPVFIVVESGNYEAQVILNGCSYTNGINVIFNPIPVFSLGEDLSLCEGEITVLTVDIPNAIISWQDGSTSSEYEVNSPGIYSATANLLDCTYSDEISIDYIIIPNPSLGEDSTICENETIVLSSGQSFDNYLWSTGETDNEILVSQASTYWLEFQEQNCLKRDSINIMLAPLPVSSLPDVISFCQDSLVVIRPDGVFDTFEWIDLGISGDITLGEESVLNYRMSLDNCVNTGILEIREVVIPEIDLGEITEICRQETLLLTPTPFRDDYQWHDGSVGASFMVSESGFYSASLEIDGCTKHAEIIINVEDCDDTVLIFPNAFAPSRGGINAEFKALVGSDVEILEYQLYIFDRWGNMVFASDDHLESWNGFFQGKELNPGVYVYTAIGLYSFGQRVLNFDIRGDITLLR
jgi:gliding motility-associated-like protein